LRWTWVATSLNWLTTTDGRTGQSGRLRPGMTGVRGPRHSSRARGTVGKPHDRRSGGRIAPVTPLVSTLGPRRTTLWRGLARRGPAPVRGEAFVTGQGETATAIASITPRNLIDFPGVFVAVEIGVSVRSPLATQMVLPSGVITRK
jgi:hypothetical protein